MYHKKRVKNVNKSVFLIILIFFSSSLFASSEILDSLVLWIAESYKECNQSEKMLNLLATDFSLSEKILKTGKIDLEKIYTRYSLLKALCYFYSTTKSISKEDLLKIAKLIIENGANINYVDDDNDSIL